MATENIGDRFRRWRRGRPFWGGLFMILSGLEMFASANMELDNIKIHIGPQGFYSYLLPVMMIAAGTLTWFSPAQRLFYGVIGIITALYSFIGLNLGGWIAGMLLGIVGGALVVAWGPPSPNAPQTTPSGDRPTEEIEPGPRRRPGPGKALLIIAPLLLAATVTVAGNRPAQAAECPEGLPSRKASPSATAAKPKPKPTTAKPGATPTTTGTASPSTSPSASPAPTEEGTGNPILDGINDFWEGVGDFFTGGGKEESASPAPSASAPTAPAPTATKPGASPSASPSASASRTPKAEEIPCLGARQMGVLADDDGIPRAGAKPGVVKAASVTMYNSSYDGVAEVPTGNGPIKSLKFTMDKVVNKPFTLTIDEPGDATTVIESGELILDGNVEFYSPTFKGKLFGLIPVTFTPESPPPLTLPVLWFTDVTLDLAYVRSDVLTAKPLDIAEETA
ncbi:hypothetical protein Ait01nite_038340 [Actinoplanes italicus]|uniref:Uncharacterized protein n=1 Tax=Actinoplanes italicus TaxID=113567 RepID=A0A2T0K2R2_9ACTN|nr:DUF6114 domain-containing protein [Actinoplanes italicus]PRX17129.1 hypothetical protein CLV67_117186 [Actinoplanes italicus]GIE30789.1 hypothetical protein Ait01nite_038340 [Actinoplanes italicus]